MRSAFFAPIPFNVAIAVAVKLWWGLKSFRIPETKHELRLAMRIAQEDSCDSRRSLHAAQSHIAFMRRSFKGMSEEMTSMDEELIALRSAIPPQYLPERYRTGGASDERRTTDG